jgi:hypothetical protein
MTADRLGQFAEGFTSWRRILSQAGDEFAQLDLLRTASHDIAHFVFKGLSDIIAADELQAMAVEFGLDLEHQDEIQQIIAGMVNEADALRARHFEGLAPPKTNGHDTQPAADLGEWDAGEDPGPIPPRQWLLANQFCIGFISSLVAAGGVGKSALRLLQFISLALGRSLCGQHIFRRCRVLLISLEDDRDEVQRRIQAVLDHFNIARSELKGWLFCANPQSKLAELKDKQRVAGALDHQIKQAIERHEPELVAIDPFVKLHSLGENDSTDMNFVCGLLVRLAVEHQIAVDVPHHVHKGQIEAGDADAGRGSSGIRDAGRLIYTLLPMSEDEAKAFGIEPEDRSGYVRLDPAKVNIAPRTGKATWFRLVGVPLGNGTPEYPNGDTIQVAEPWQPPSAWAGTSSVILNAILDDIDRGMDNGQRYSNAPKNERPVWPVVQKHYPDKSEGQCREIIHAWLRTGLLTPKDYDDPVQRRSKKGLYVDSTKRPS